MKLWDLSVDLLSFCLTLSYFWPASPLPASITKIELALELVYSSPLAFQTLTRSQLSGDQGF